MDLVRTSYDRHDRVMFLRMVFKFGISNNFADLAREEPVHVVRGDALVQALNYVENDDVELFKRLFAEQKETLLSNCKHPHDDSNILLRALSRRGRNNRIALFLLDQREVIELIGFVKPQETAESTQFTIRCVFAIVRNANKTLLHKLVQKSRSAIRRSISSDAGHFVSLFLLHIIGLGDATEYATYYTLLKPYFSRLMIAARLNEVEQVNDLIRGNDGHKLINKRCANGLTALHFAACYGHSDVVTALLNAGAKVNSDSRECVISPMEFAIVAGHDDIAVELMRLDMTGIEELNLRAILINVLHVASSKGCRTIIDEILYNNDCEQLLNEKNEKGYTALMVAVGAGQVKTVQYLLSQGSNWYEKDSDNSTVLHFAALSGSTRVVQCIVDYMQDVIEAHSGNRENSHLLKLLTAKDKWDRTAVFYAALNNDNETVDVLIRLATALAGMDGDIQTCMPVSIFLGAAAGGNIPMIEARYITYAGINDGFRLRLNDLLIRRDMNGYTAAHAAAFKGKRDTAVFLVRHMLDARPFNDNMLLHALLAAAAAGLWDTIDTILNNNAQLLHAKSSEGMTALMSASQTGQLETVNNLLSREGAHWNHDDHHSEMSMALKYAACQGHTDVLKAMLDSHEIWQGPHREHVVRLLQNDGLNWSAMDVNKETIVALFIIVDHTLGRGRGEDKLLENWQAVKLHTSAAVGNDDIIKQVIDKSHIVDIVNKKDVQGKTALIFAARAGHLSTVNLLLSIGASVMESDKLKSTALHYAAEAGHTNIVRAIINFVRKVNFPKIKVYSGLFICRDLNGNTAAKSAAAKGQTQTVGVLLDAMIKTTENRTLESRDSLITDALHTAAFVGYNRIIKKIAEDDIRFLNKRDDIGRTALMFAAKTGKVPAVELLLREGAVLVDTDFDKWTALHYAARYGHTAAVKSLLDCAIKNDMRNRGEYLVKYITAKDKWDQTASYLAAKYGYRGTAEALMKYVSNAMHLSDLLLSALFASAAGGYNDIIEKIRFENRGIDLFNMRDTRGRTALMIASDKGWASSVELLLECGANLTKVDNCRFIALHYAAEAGRKNVVEQILEYVRNNPANLQLIDLIRHRNCYERTAVQLAAKNGHTKTAMVLLNAMLRLTQHRFDVISNDVLRNALHAAAAAGFGDIIDRVRQRAGEHILNMTDAIGRNALMFAAETGQVETVTQLLTMGACCTDRDSDNWTPLHYAASLGHHGVVNAIVDYYQIRAPGLLADLVMVEDSWHRSAAYYAAEEGHSETAECLMAIMTNLPALFVAARWGFNEVISRMDQRILNEGDANGQTALMIAADAGHAHTVELLLKRGASCVAKDNDVKTVMHYAVCAGHAEVVQVLIRLPDKDLKMLLSAKEHMGFTAVQLASQKGHQEIAKTLMDAMCERKKIAIALLVAAAGGNNVEVHHIIENNLRHQGILNDKDANGRTALMLSAGAGHASAVTRLLTANARWEDIEFEGKTCLHYAAEAGRTTVVQALVHSPTIQNSEFIRLLLVMNNTNGDNALQSAASNGHTDIVTILLDFANQNHIFQECSRLALRSAIIGCRFQCVVHIINFVQKKIDKYEGDDSNLYDNRLAVHQPIKHMTDNILEKLFFVPMEVVNFLDIRPLHWASQDYEPNDLVDFLEKCFRICRCIINLNAVDCKGFTALMYCAGGGKLEAFSWLVRHGADMRKIAYIEKKNVLFHMVEQCAEQPSLRNDILQVFDYMNANENTRPVINKHTQIECNVPSRGIHQQKMTVLQLAAATGNVEIFKHFISDKNHVHRRGNKSFYLVGPWYIRYLKLIADHCSEDERAQMLRLEALRYFLVKLANIRQLLFIAVLFVHIIHMSCFSAIIVPACLKSSSSSYGTIACHRDKNSAYSAFLAWPAFLFLYELGCMVKYIKFAVRNPQRAVKDFTRICSKSSRYTIAIECDQMASHVFSIGFCAIFLAWCVTYDHIDDRTIVMVTLTYGWMLTLELLKGIRILQAFCLVLKIVFVKDVLRILLLHLFTLIGFTLAIYVYLINDESSGKDSMRITDMFLQMFMTIFDKSELLKNLSDDIVSTKIRLVFVFYTLLSSVVLLNVLIAMMNNTYNAVNDLDRTLFYDAGLRWVAWVWEDETSLIAKVANAIVERFVFKKITDFPNSGIPWSSDSRENRVIVKISD